MHSAERYLSRTPALRESVVYELMVLKRQGCQRYVLAASLGKRVLQNKNLQLLSSLASSCALFYKTPVKKYF